MLVHHDSDLYDLTVKTAHGSEVIDTTSSHLFWDPAARTWVKAGSLKHGEHLLTADGTPAVASGGHVPADKDGWMWDLTIQDDHDFYVLPAESGNDGQYYYVNQDGVTAVLVHNINDPCDIPTLKSYARQIRQSGDTPRAIRSRVIAVGQDEAGNMDNLGIEHN